MNPYRTKNGEEFNPKIRQGNKKSASKVWDDKGEFNANNKADLVQTIKGLLDGLMMDL